MCGRYFIDDDTLREAEKVVSELDRKLRRAGGCAGSIGYTGIEPITKGDVYPSHYAAVMTGRASGFCLEGMRWGFPKYQGTGLLINARAETVLERKMFRESVLHRRCVVPAKWFYEWDSDKNKASFKKNGNAALYMAAFYSQFQDGEHFIILTTQANASVSPVHHRMPLVLEEHELESWVSSEMTRTADERCKAGRIYNDYEEFLKSILNKTPMLLQREQEYEQQSLVLG